MHATCVSACEPAADHAERARALAAPGGGPQRRWPRPCAAARGGSPRSRRPARRRRRRRAGRRTASRAASHAYDLRPASPSSWSTADMTANIPPSTGWRVARPVVDRARAQARWKHSSIGSSASSGDEQRFDVLLRQVERHGGSLGAAPRDEADLAARLEHRPLDVVERAELLPARERRRAPRA